MEKILFSIREARPVELSSLIKIYHAAFPKHTIFQRSRKEILKYLQQTQHHHKAIGGGYLVALVRNRIVGAMLVRKEAEDISGNHAVWKYNHLAVSPAYQGRGIGKALLQKADTKIQAAMKKWNIKTSKIELGVAESEQRAVQFYLKNGFKIEGKLYSHYRYNEMVYAMGKEISS